jgi:cytoskeletal protein RodZ
VDERETLGSYLKNQRESKKISLREVTKNTRVREYILRAIEEDRHDLLPAATYVKGFLLAYAKYLRLDRNDVLLRYERVLKGEPAPPPPPPPPKPKKKISWNTKQIWVVGGVIAASFIVFFFFSPYSFKPAVEPIPEKPVPERPIVEGEPSIAPSPPVTATTGVPEEKPVVEEKKPLAPSPPVPATTSVQGKKAFSLQLKAVEETWVRLQVEGQSEKEMTFKRGDGISVLASNRIRIVIGNAGGLNLIWNGKLLDKFGKSGEVVTLVITSQGVEVTRPEKPKSP